MIRSDSVVLEILYKLQLVTYKWLFHLADSHVTIRINYDEFVYVKFKWIKSWKDSSVVGIAFFHGMRSTVANINALDGEIHYSKIYYAIIEAKKALALISIWFKCCVR